MTSQTYQSIQRCLAEQRSVAYQKYVVNYHPLNIAQKLTEATLPICLHPLSIPEGMQNLRDFYISPYILGILYATIFKISTPTDPINITQHAKHEQN